MTLELYTAYVLATLLVLAIPGPTIMLVVSYALSHGRRSALATVTGVALGDATAASLSLLGLGALLATSAMLFSALKWIGAAYLVWLGVKLWRSKPVPLGTHDLSVRSSRTIVLHAWIVTALNPKGIAFFIAFLPHFIAPGAPIAPQLVLMGVTFVVLAIINALAYAWLASAVRTQVKKPATMQIINRVGGSVLIGAGLMTAMVRRASA
ncbi:LysE family translocator [Breoghania sp. L-A4]|uniref:LysE family translocator n=1 Tax=Breoghania sp. L-A4 TaxID=2304600 RepID=UPI000E35F17B|nr:LysE family translocator [Breoghania sp. L-A4]AXS41357.1 LysE family translocator [Breoghania sp. L-A4]